MGTGKLKEHLLVQGHVHRLSATCAPPGVDRHHDQKQEKDGSRGRYSREGEGRERTCEDCLVFVRPCDKEWGWVLYIFFAVILVYSVVIYLILLLLWQLSFFLLSLVFFLMSLVLLTLKTKSRVNTIFSDGFRCKSNESSIHPRRIRSTVAILVPICGESVMNAI